MRPRLAPVAVPVARRSRCTLAAMTLVGACWLLPTVASAQGNAPAVPDRAHEAGALTWGPAPDVFPKGARMAVVSGNPGATGPYVVQLALPSGYRIASHFHPTDEHVRVKSGVFLVGMGDTVDAKQMKRLARGDTITAPAQMHHYAEARGRTIVEVSGNGPFQLTYVNPADKPKM